MSSTKKTAPFREAVEATGTVVYLNMQRNSGVVSTMDLEPRKECHLTFRLHDCCAVTGTPDRPVLTTRKAKHRQRRILRARIVIRVVTDKDGRRVEAWGILPATAPTAAAATPTGGPSTINRRAD